MDSAAAGPKRSNSFENLAVIHDLMILGRGVDRNMDGSKCGLGRGFNPGSGSRLRRDDF
jgi:hypothetical protein